MDTKHYEEDFTTTKFRMPHAVEGTPVTGQDTQRRFIAELEEPHAPRHQTAGTRILWGVISFVPLACLAMVALTSGSVQVLFGALAMFWSGLCLLFMGNRLFRLELDPGSRTRWGLALLLLAPFAIPTFWWRFIYNAPTSRLQHA